MSIIKNVAKRMITLVLAAIMVFSVVPMQALATEPVTIDSLRAEIAAYLDKLGITPDMPDVMLLYAYGNHASYEEAQASITKLDEFEEKGAQLSEEEQQILLAEDNTQLCIRYRQVVENAYATDLLAEFTVNGVKFTSKDGNFSNSNGTLTATVKGSSGVCGGESASMTITVTNTSGEAGTVSFSMAQTSINSIKIGNEDIKGKTTYTKVLDADGSFTIQIDTGENDTENKLVISNVTFTSSNKTFTVTAEYPTALGSVTSSVQATSVDANGTTTMTISKVNATDGVTLTANSSTFLCWVDKDNKLLSTEKAYKILPSADTTVKAVMTGGNAYFLVDGVVVYDNLNEAAEAADKTVVLMNNGSVSGSHTIPSGVTLLIPYSSANSVQTTQPGCIGYSTPTPFRTLTMAQGASITVQENGAISIGGNVSTASGGTATAGAPSGPVGWVIMEKDSVITLENKANLYAWGYIQKGQSGEGKVIAKSGASVYEAFQYVDYRGGTQISNMNSDKRVFPLSQYYIQNIEVPVTYYTGAYGKLHTRVDALRSTHDIDFTFVGSGGVFIPTGTNATLTKDYIESEDRLKMTVNGDAKLSSFSLTIAIYTVKTSDFAFPLTNNISFEIQSGTTTIEQSIAILPGAQAKVAKDAEIVIASASKATTGYTGGHNLIIYDEQEWIGKGYVFQNEADYDMLPVRYAPGKAANANRSVNNQNIDINGTITANGYFYTTDGGARIVSSEGTGKIVLINGAGTDTSTYQANIDRANNNALQVKNVPMTSAKLMNGDGSYTETAGAAAGTTYAYCAACGKWYAQGKGEVTFDANYPDGVTGEGAMDPQKIANTCCGENLNENAFTATDYVFDSWNTEKNGSGASYADGALVKFTENTTLYAQWKADKNTLNFYLEEGEEAYASITAKTDEAIELPAAPTKEGYTFKGWADKDGNSVTLTDKMPGSSMDLYAVWEIKQITITFNTDGGTEIASITQNYGTAITAPANPTKEGYEFKGWDKEIPTTMPADDLTITAKWTPKQYTITFDTDGGTVIAPLTQNYGTAITAPANPTKEGYTFAGWEPAIPETMPVDGMNVKAKWTANQYTVTWNVDGVASTTNQTYGDKLVLPAAPSKAGYTFNGWVDADNNPVTGDTIFTNANNNTAYTATWTAVAYTIGYDLAGGALPEGVTNPEEYTIESDAFTLNEPTKTGYTFAGWTGTGLDQATKDVTIPTGSTGNRSYTATWTAVAYTIGYDLAGGALPEGVTNPEEYTIESDAFTLNEPTREGYTFDGWTGSNGTTAQTEVTIAKGSTGDRSYTANWTIKTYTVTWTDENGNSVGNDTVEHGSDADKDNIPTVPEKYGYSGEWSAPATNVTGATTITPAYTPKSYGIAWMVDGERYTWEGADDGVTVVVYDNAITLPAKNPEKLGHTFEYWYAEVNGQEKKITAETAYNKDNVGEAVAAMAAGETEISGYTQIHAAFSPNSYNAVFHANGGAWENDEITKTVSATFGTDITAPADPTKEGYTFDGWTPAVGVMDDVNGKVYNAKWKVNMYTITFKDHDGTVLQDDQFAYGDIPSFRGKLKEMDERYIYTFTGWDHEIEAVTGEETYIAQYDKTDRIYTLTFDLDGGVIDGNPSIVIEGVYETIIDPIKTPTKTGHTFAGWTVDGNLIDELPKKLTATMTIKATWTPIKYTITFDSDGGTKIAPIEQDYGAAITAPADPTKEGYTFIDWYPAVPKEMPLGGMTVKAKWKINQYTINFNTAGGSEIAPITKDYNSAISAPAAPTREGYTFDRWDVEIPEKMPAKDMTITAIWKADENTLKFYKEKGGEEYASITAKTDEAIELPAAPTKEGHTFNGWATEGGEIVTLTDKMPTSGMDLYAVWGINTYTIAFDTDGGTAIDPITQQYNTKVTKPADPTKEGYTFAGWDVTIPEKMPAVSNVNGIMTIKALWTINQYTITFANTGDTVIAPITQDYNSAITAPDAPEKTGYSFDGWDIAIPATMPAKNITVTAKWTINQYTITFDTDGGSEIAPITQDYNTAVTAPEAPTKEGYVFDGWEPVIPATMPAGNMTIKAKWIACWYLTYTDVDESEHNNPAYFLAADLPLTLKDAARPNFVFMGWTCDQLNITEPTKNLQIPEGTIVDLTLKAHFEKAYASLVSNGTTTYYLTLAEAVADAQSGDVVNLLDDATGAGMVIDKNITIDFGGHTYTVNSAIGSTGTETLGFQILVGKTVVMKDGKITANGDKNAQGKVTKMLIQNYANLTLDNITLTANDNTLYCLSVNSGNVQLKNCTINAAEGEVAFDACKYGTYEAPVITADNCTVTGIVEVTGGQVTVNGGKYTTNDTDVFVVDSGKLTINGDVTVDGGGKNQTTAVWAKNVGHVVINGGNFKVSADESAVQGYNDLIYAKQNGVIEINGGTFEGPARNSDGQRFLLNLQDNSNAKIIVSGGYFYGFDPQDTGTEPAGVNDDFTADGCIAAEDEDNAGNYIVKAHTHKYYYSADSRTLILTEFCHDGCRHEATAYLELDESVALDYTGTAIEPYSAVFSDNWMGTRNAVTYKNNVYAGNATATLSADGAAVIANFTITGSEDDLLKGDLDLDGDVDAKDMTLMARHVGKIELLTNPQALANADVNSDGQIDAADVTGLAKYIGKIITSWEEL